MGGEIKPTWGEDLALLALAPVALALAPVICVPITVYCTAWIWTDLRGPRPEPREILDRWALLCVGTVWLPLSLIRGAVGRFLSRAVRLACEVTRYVSTETEISYWLRRRQVVDLRMFRPYEYPKLEGSHQIRLFEVLPGGGGGRGRGQDGGDVVRGRIVQSNLSRGRSYDAVSYTWADENGDSARTERIYLLDQRATVAVTRNCVAVLKQLRHPKKRRLVWIDAICIDQQSDLDRNHQVSLMAGIYTSARTVIAYTGAATEESNKLFNYMNSIHPKDLVLPTGPESGWAGLLDTEERAWAAPSTGQLMTGLERFWYCLSVLRHRAAFSCSQWWSAIPFVTRPGHAPAAHAAPLTEEQITAAAAEYFSRRWFQRVWVLQEVSLPEARRVTIQCGAKSTSAIRALHSLSLLPSDGGGPGALALGRFYLMLRKKIVHPRKSHLLDILIETRGRSCSDPRDKIFGVLSIASRLDGDRSFPGLVADYDMDMARVNTVYSKLFIHRHGLVFFWSLIKSPPAVPNLPSWSADWSAPWPNYNAVSGRHLPAITSGAQQGRPGPDLSFEKDYSGSRELLKITVPEVTRGVFTRDGHLDGSDAGTLTVEEVGSLEEGHHLVELQPGVCALLRERREYHEPYHEFVQVCPHHLDVDGLREVVGAWAEYVVDGRIPVFGNVAGKGECFGYLSGLRTYYIS